MINRAGLETTAAILLILGGGVGLVVSLAYCYLLLRSRSAKLLIQPRSSAAACIGIALILRAVALTQQ